MLLVGVAVPLKHLYGDASLVQALGPVHGLLFLLYLLDTLRMGVKQHCRFDTTRKVLVFKTSVTRLKHTMRLRPGLDLFGR